MQRGKDMRGSRGTSPRVHYAWLVLAASTLAVFGCLGLARFGYGLILPSMQDGLGLDNPGRGSLATAGLVGYALLAILGGVLAAHFGPRVVVALGLGAAGVGMFLTGLSETLWTALVFQFIAGMGSGASNVPVMGLLPMPAITWKTSAVQRVSERPVKNIPTPAAPKPNATTTRGPKWAANTPPNMESNA